MNIRGFVDYAALRGITFLAFIGAAAFGPYIDTVSARETFAEHHAWAASHVNELPPQLRAIVISRQARCGAPLAATHMFARTTTTTATRFIALHYESLWCPTQAFCSSGGCLHEIYVSSGGNYQRVFSGYVGEARIVREEDSVNLVVTRTIADDRLLRWTGRSFVRLR